MPPNVTPVFPPTQRRKALEAVTRLSIVEAVGWGGCALLATLALLTTLGQSFPARERSLYGEALAIALAAAAGLLSWRRASRPVSTAPSPPWAAPLALAGLALRCLVAMPAHLFFVVCAAAGFAA